MRSWDQAISQKKIKVLGEKEGKKIIICLVESNPVKLPMSKALQEVTDRKGRQRKKTENRDRTIIRD